MKTRDDKLVMPGIFKLYDTVGMPLAVIVDYLNDNGVVVAWDDFIEQAVRAKWKRKTIETRVFEAISDVFGAVYFEQFKFRWNLIFERLAT